MFRRGETASLCGLARPFSAGQQVPFPLLLLFSCADLASVRYLSYVVVGLTVPQHSGISRSPHKPG